MTRLGGAVLAIVLGMGATQALANDGHSAEVSSCILKTGVKGTYESRQGQYGSFVVPTRARQSDANKVNDCLLDARQVQFGAGTRSGAVTGVTTVSRAEECRKIRNRKIVNGIAWSAGFAVGVGSALRDAAIIGGIAGNAINIPRANRSYQDCLNAPRKTATSFGTCRPGNSIMRGGSGYCRRH